MSITTLNDAPSSPTVNTTNKGSPNTPTDINGFPSLPTDIVPSSGVVRRKPARRANTAERRATHNAVERQRRETLNGRFLDLAALLPNLVSVRRPSKSAIVNSSIAIIHTQRRLRAIAGREIRQLAAEAEALRREVNEWRSRSPNSTVVEEPQRSSDFQALMDLEDLDEEEMRMGEEERVAYEMRGESGNGMFGEDGDGDELEDELSDVAAQQVAQAQAQAQAVQQQQQAAAKQRMRSQSTSGRPSQHIPQPHHMSGQHRQPLPFGFHNGLGQFHPQSLPASYAFDNGSGFPTGAPNGVSLPHTLGEADAAKLAAWNAHIYSALAAQQAQSQAIHAQSQGLATQQQWAAAMQFQTPPNSSQGSPGLFGASQQNQQQQQQQALLAHFQRATMAAANQSIFGSGSDHPRSSSITDDDDVSGGGSPHAGSPLSYGGSSFHSADNSVPISPSGAGSVSGASTTSSGPSVPSLGSSSASAALGDGFLLNSFPSPTSASSSLRSPWNVGSTSPASPIPIPVGGGGGGTPNYASMYMLF